ncbi:caspase, EACC1-associated type [Streptomyces ochraceiscleroticus]|uniref:P-loop NTPase fold protein n=1 Tax=Streptomyces ochraceiscleroticus TaxID=47761 RepID=A0ABW1MSP7_9ACTN|nr:P-loop NTPase fold protein [Streptomyces ochraceiscleroticus]
MARLPDPRRSQAVLIGCSRYAELDDIPAIRNNLVDLGAILEEAGGFRQPLVIAEPSHIGEVGTSLRRLADRTEDVLLVYYAGHGLIGDDGELHLGLSDTTQAELSTSALPFTTVRRIVQQSPARVKIVILDCCFSGRALDFTSMAGAPATNLAGLSGIFGTFTLTSSSATRLSMAREGEPFTAFTGELIRLLKQGIAGPAELLTLRAIAGELQHTMRALGYPPPQVQSVNSAGELGLVRNPAYDLAYAAATGPATAAPPTADIYAPSEEAVSDDDVQGYQEVEGVGEFEFEDFGSVGEAGDVEAVDDVEDVEDVEWFHDAPATVDLLNRAPVAKVLALRLVETHMTQPDTSFLVHLDGPWGSGKSSLLNLLEEHVDGSFRVARFDAWQQSRLAPAWWSLLTCLRQEITRGRPWWRRPFIRVRESAARARRTGAPYAMAFVVVAVLAALIGYLIWPKNPSLLNWQEQAKAVTALLAALGTLGAGVLVAARLFLWDSVRGARLFEQTQANPMADISAHFQWLLQRSDKPVAFFIDDLDRCDQAYVVEFLDMIQTLVRTMGASRSANNGTNAGAYFVVAADGAWLRRSYESAHESFVECIAEPGRPLGYLFLDKLFQLSLPMPVLSTAARSSYLDEMLRVTQARPEAESSPLPESPRPRSDGDFLERLRQFEVGRAEWVSERLNSITERRRAEHTLRKFAPVLGDNPRAVKKFLNTYSILRSIRFLEDIHVDPDALALWCLICVRWPNVADHLAACPEAVAGIAEPLWCSEHFPGPLRAAAESPELRAVVTSPDGGPLTPDLIRHCCGARRSATGGR